MHEHCETESLDWLLAQVCYHHHARAHELLEKVGLYRGQPPLLEALWRQDGQTHTALAEHLHITPATISRMLQRMEKTGFIHRQADADDQRVSRVFLTPAGRAVRVQVTAIFAQMERETFDGITEPQLVELRTFLTRLRDNLRSVKGTGLQQSAHAPNEQA